MRWGLLLLVLASAASPGWARDRAANRDRGRAATPGQAQAATPTPVDRAAVGIALTCPSCEDYNLCTIDSCDTTTGTCRHDPNPCDDGNPCTEDRCEPGSGSPAGPFGHCVSSPGNLDGQPCDDHNACTMDETCSGGSCSWHILLFPGSACNDGDDCTDSDTCTQVFTPGSPTVIRCVGNPAPAGASCDDGNPCTGPDACNASRHCAGAALGGTSCDDADACTSGDRCVEGDGTAHCAGTPLDCSDGDLCTQDRCDAATGACSHPPVDCEDGNGCTSDACDPSTGCRRDNVPGTCSDGNGCTTGDACTGGNCVSQPVTCPTSGCSVGRCDPLDGPSAICRYHDDPSLCPQGDQCSFSECRNGSCHYVGMSGIPCSLGPGSCSLAVCVRGDCRPDVTFPCNDNNPCTADTCTGISTCTPTPLPDGTSCGVGACSTGTCHGGVCGDLTTRNCDDFNPCTVDSCDAAGACVHSPVVCEDDQNPCTRDICSTTAGGCIHDPQSGNLCAETTCSRTFCQDGACSGIVPLTCDDHDPCTSDSCQPGLGCVNDRNTCDDGNQCTTDGCTQSGGCVHTLATGFGCNDGNPCTALDACIATAGGVVCAGTPMTCHDGNPCTEDVGVPDENTCLCEYRPIEDACCANGSPRSCDDGNRCTADRCDPASGCVHDGPAGPVPETCNGLDDDCDGTVDERETLPLCTVLPYNVRDSMAMGSFFVTCRLTPACPGAVPPPVEAIGTVWLSAADLLFSSADNEALPDPFAHCDTAIVENVGRRMINDKAVTFVFDPAGNGVCGTSGGGRPGLVKALADVPDGKLARACVKWRNVGLIETERCGIVLVKHDGGPGPQPLSPVDEEELPRLAP